MMDVEQGEGKPAMRMHVSTVISMLNCIPSASTDRMLRIIEAAKAQGKAEEVKKAVGDGLTRGSLCAVLFDSDTATANNPSPVWYGFVRRYGVRVGTKFKEWMCPIDFDDDTVSEKLVLQFTWLAPADRKHWGRDKIPTYAFKSFGASGSQEVPLACVIGVVKYERVSDGRRSVPKLFRIDPADADTVESAARGIAVQGSLHGAGEAGAGGTEGTKKTTKKKGAAKGGSKGAG